MKRNRIIACVLCALILAGCGAGGTRSDEPQIVLDVWHQWADQNEALKSAVESAAAEYENAHPLIHIELHGLNGETYKEKIAMDFAGKAEDIDVFYYFAPAKLKQLADAGRVLPLNGCLTDEILSEVKEGTTASTSFDGKIYGLPIDSSLMCVFCNTALFEAAGAELPSTYDELIEAGRKLSALGVTPLAVGAQTPWLAGLLYELLAERQVGADTVKAMLKGEISMSDTPGFRTAAEQAAELRSSGVLGENPLNVSDSDAVAEFLNGEAAMLLDGSWAAGNIDASELDGESVAVINFPLAEGGRYSADYIGGTGSGTFFVNSGTDAPDEAADFTIYLTRYIGMHAYEIGTGLTCWSADAGKVSPTLKKVIGLYSSLTNRAPSWDKELASAASDVHLTQCQALLTDEPDIDRFISAHDEAIGSQK